MPLSEFVYQLADTKFDSSSQQKSNNCSADLPSGPKNDFVELIWDSGQIQLSRARKNQVSNGVQSQTSKNIDKDAGNARAMESVVNEACISVPSFEMGLNQDDELASWLSYSINDSLQQDYCQELFAELSGITVNENPQNKFALSDKRSNESQSASDLHTVSVHNDLSSEQGSVLQVSSACDDDGNRPRNAASYLNSSSSQRYQKSFPCFRSQVSTDNGDNTNNSSCLASSRDPKQVPPPGGCFSSMKVQKQLPVSFSTNSSLMNFSHFARPAAAKANFQNTVTRMGLEISSMERIGSKDSCVVASISKPPESMVINTLNGLVSSKVDAKPLDSGPADEPVLSMRAKVMNQEDDSRNNKNPGQSAESSGKGLADGERTTEPAVASSSVCSGNSVQRVSDEPTRNLKRKHRETEESEGPSDDVEEESQVAKKGVPGRGGNGTKRSRAAEVHNLSERRRRDRINEKMRALQELIPNCNKVDKASMLDEAIEYLKTLQLQVQIMSMGAGLYMPSMMLPPGMPQMHAAHMPPFSPMSVGMGTGFGMGMHDMIGGSNGCFMVQVPPMHVAHFPGPQMSGPNALHGIRGSNSPIFGVSSQGHSMPYPCAPLVPISGGPPLKTMVGLSARKVADSMENLESAPGCSSKNSVQNVNLQMMQNSGANSSLNQTPTQSNLCWLDGFLGLTCGVTPLSTSKNNEIMKSAKEEMNVLNSLSLYKMVFKPQKLWKAELCSQLIEMTICLVELLLFVTDRHFAILVT